MDCPNCKVPMNKICLDAKTFGIKVAVEQCFKCGGLWLNDEVLFNIKPSEASKLDSVNKTLFQSDSKVTKQLSCPNDGSQLVCFTDPTIPVSIHMLRCKTCGGIWLNTCTLLQYEKWAKQKQAATESRSQEPRLKDFSKSFDVSSGILNSQYDALSKNLFIRHGEEYNAAKGAQDFTPILKNVPDNQKADVYDTIMKSENKTENLSKLSSTYPGYISQFSLALDIFRNFFNII